MIISLFLLCLCVLARIDCTFASLERIRGVQEATEKAARTTIVSYRKSEMTLDEIAAEETRLRTECRCNVQHLSSVGAFILTYDSSDHLGLSNLNLAASKEVGIEDQIASILDDDLATRQTPTDPFFSSQWPLANLSNDADINAQEGWDEYLFDQNGGSEYRSDVIVAVIDTGVDYTHPELQTMMWKNPGEIAGNGIDDDDNGIIDDVYGADYSSNNPNGNPIDRHSHGTHCAGVIGAKENNGEGIAGVASFTQGRVKIMAVKGLSDYGSGTFSGLLSSLNYAIAKGAKISSNSWGGGSSISNATEQLWDNVLQNNPNHLFVASAGNENRLVDDSYKRMCCGLNEPNLLCVASSTQADRKSSFSNYGKDYVHVFAPGSSVYSTEPNNRYGVKSGTSMACPHVSGLAALVMTMKSDLTGKDVRDLIEANVQKKPAYENLVSSGGLIDVAKTIRDVETKSEPEPGEDREWCMLVSQPECETERVKSKCPKTCNDYSGGLASTTEQTPIIGDQIIVVGGYSPSGTSKTTEILRNGSAVRCNIPPLPFGIYRQASAVISNGLVMCGGTADYRSCLRLTSDYEWVPFPELKQRWYNFNIFYMNEKLWAIGIGSRFEYIDPNIGSHWTYMNQPPHRNSDYSCSAKLSNNRIIVTGGRYRHSLNETWIFDTTNRTWTAGPHMQQARQYHGCFSIYTNNTVTEIVVVGGYCRDDSNTIPNCDRTRLNATEILSLSDMTWSHGPDFPYDIYYNRGVTSIQDDILGYSVGGSARRGKYQKEIMGLKKSNGRLEWVSVGNMTEGRYSHSAVKAPRSLTPSC